MNGILYARGQNVVVEIDYLGRRVIHRGLGDSLPLNLQQQIFFDTERKWDANFVGLTGLDWLWLQKKLHCDRGLIMRIRITFEEEEGVPLT